jgi:hypothetical protein
MFRGPPAGGYQSPSHDFDPFRLWGATLRALATLGADDPDPTALSAHIATIITLLDTMAHSRSDQ